MTELEQYIGSLEQAAIVQGLSSTNNVLFSPKAGNIIFFGYKEPDGYVLPLNVLWVDSDPSSGSYRKMRQRQSKTPASGFKNTWLVVTTMAAVQAVQYWAPEDIPNPVIISGLGGTLDERIYTSIDTTRFKPMEFVPRYYLDDRLATYFATMGLRVQNLETDVQQNTEDIEALKQGLQPQESKVLLFKQDQESMTWNLVHNFGPGFGVAVCTTLEGQYVWPETAKASADGKSFVLQFLVPVAGQAVLTYVQNH